MMEANFQCTTPTRVESGKRYPALLIRLLVSRLLYTAQRPNVYGHGRGLRYHRIDHDEAPWSAMEALLPLIRGQ